MDGDTPVDPPPVLPELANTDMGCAGPDDGPAPVMELEAAYLDVLRSAHKVEVDNGRLVLQSDLATLVFASS